MMSAPGGQHVRKSQHIASEIRNVGGDARSRRSCQGVTLVMNILDSPLSLGSGNGSIIFRFGIFMQAFRGTINCMFKT